MHIAKMVGATALAFGAIACGDLTGLNTDPNNPTDAPTGPLFTRAVNTSVSRWLGTTYNLRQTEFVAQHLAEVQYPDEDRYIRLRAGNTQAAFNNSYTSELKDLYKIIAKAKAQDEPNTYAPAMILKTWVFGYLTDTWGDVPYFDALKGDSLNGTVEALLLPKYDPQKDIYDDFFKTLDDASKALDGATDLGLGSADPLYGGDGMAWQKFANSLRLRYAMRLANVDPTTAATQAAAAIAAPGGVFTSNADNAALVWPGDGVYDNPWTVNFQTRDDHRLSNSLTRLLVPDDDPRLYVWAQPVEDSARYANGYGGMPNGLTPAAAGQYFSISSRPGEIFYSGATSYGYFGSPKNAKLPSYLMTYAEVSFLLAEARERGWITTGTAAQYYQDGIRASMEQWGIIDQSKINAFLAKPAIAYKGGVDGQKQIAQQKWVALFTDGGQAWAEWRRTGQPSWIAPGPNANPQCVPRRFFYSTTDKSANGANVEAAIQRLVGGKDKFSSRMYWDSKGELAPTYEGAPLCIDP
jgi:hypothetical protein